MMTTPTDKEHRSSSKKKRRSEERDAATPAAAAAPPPPPSSRKKRPASSSPSSDVRIKVVRPAKASSSAAAPAALAPFVGYLAHGRLGDAAKAAQTIVGGGGGKKHVSGGGGGDDDPDGAKAASKVRFDVYEAPRRAPVYVAQLAGPRKEGTKDKDEGDGNDANANATTATPRLLLVGRTDGAEQAGAAAAGWHAVGVYSRSKGTLTLARAQDGRLARIEPVLPEAAAAAAAALAKRAADAAAAAQQGEAAREQSRRLVDAFGSTRRKRQLAAREEGAVRSDRLLDGGAGVQAALARVNAAAAREGATREAVLARAAASRNVPPHDPSATCPGKAYRVRAFFPASFWDALNFGQLLAAAEDPEQMAKLRERRIVPEYVLSRCDALLRPPSGAAAAAGGGAGPSSPSSPSGGSSKDARRARAKLLAAVAALLSLHAGRASVRVPVGPAGLDDAARRLRVCGRGEALEALLGLLYVPAGRVEGEGDAGVEQAAAEAEAKAKAKVKAEEEGGAAAGEAGGGGGGGDEPKAAASPAAAARSPRPAADVYVRDDRQKALALAYALVIALEAEGWRMGPEAFEALRAELRVGARDLVARFRELGCDCVAGAKGAAAGAGAGAAAASYSVSLLQEQAAAAAPAEGSGARTLEDAFPKAKRPPAKKQR